jgi:hypothetical protein
MATRPLRQITGQHSASTSRRQPSVQASPRGVTPLRVNSPWRATASCAPRRLSGSAPSTSCSSPRRSHPMPRPLTSDQADRAWAHAAVASGATKCTSSLAAHGGRMASRLGAWSRGRKQPGAHAWALLGPSVGTRTSNGPVLKRLRCAGEGTSPDKCRGPGGSKRLTKAQPCGAWRTTAHGRSLVGSNAPQPWIWSPSCAPQGAERGPPAPNATRQGCACPGRT